MNSAVRGKLKEHVTYLDDADIGLLAGLIDRNLGHTLDPVLDGVRNMGNDLNPPCSES